MLGLLRWWAVVLVLFLEVSSAKSSIQDAERNGTNALDALVKRRLPPSLHSAFDFALTPDEGSSEAFNVSQGRDGRVKIVGTTTSALSKGLLTYLRTLGGDIYWSSDTFETLPKRLPKLTESLSAESWAELRYMFNVVTYSYTTAFYGWNEWEYLLDWCALHGINFPLAIGGQEYIWREVYRDFGLNDTAIYAWFSGPAFESWQRMGNIHGSWGASGAAHPVTAHWIDAQWALQQRIVARMLALDMTPVLPAFAGFVPPALHDALGGPAARVGAQWENEPVAYTNDTALDPTWDAFTTVQAAFLRTQRALYGNWTSHYYSVDLFNELPPSSLDTAYLTNNTRSVVASLRAADPEAVWVMQGWLFVSASYWNATTIEALLAGAEEDEMIVLDLTSEGKSVWDLTSDYFGHRWIWNLLHDYGQNQGLYGALDFYASEPLRAKALSNGTLRGIGLTPEGLNQNEVVYELMLDVPWSSVQIDTVSWLDDFANRRYGLDGVKKGASALINEAWADLHSSAYNNTNHTVVNGVIKSVFELVPDIANINNRTGHHPTLLTYDPADVVHAWQKLLQATKLDASLFDAAAFRYDYVDITRQVLANLFIPLYDDMIAAWNASAPDMGRVARLGSQLVALLKDADAVLATDENFLLGRWIEQAKAWSDGSEADTRFLEYEARNQITLWGPATSAPWTLDRYASKQWAGVVSEFYAPGWSMFVSYLNNHSSPYFNATGLPAYNKTEWMTELLGFEQSWQTKVWGTAKGESWTTKGDAKSVVDGVFEKWKGVLETYYAI